MLSRLRNLLTAAPAPPVAKIPEGQRVYAIGDIHGRADLLAGMIAAIDADDLARGSAQTTVVLLGDLIDRGPDSAGFAVYGMAAGDTTKLTLRIPDGIDAAAMATALGVTG